MQRLYKVAQMGDCNWAAHPTLSIREGNMAKVKTNPIIEQLRGKIGDLVFKRYGDEVVVARM